MADTKISALTETTSLNATDHFVVVQSGANKKAPLNDILNQIEIPWGFAVSDETTALTTGDGKIEIHVPVDMEVQSIFAGLTGVGSTSGTTTIDIELNGASVFTTNLLTIDFSEETSLTAATAANLTTTTWDRGDTLKVNIDAVTGGADETGLKIYVVYKRQAV